MKRKKKSSSAGKQKPNNNKQDSFPSSSSKKQGQDILTSRGSPLTGYRIVSSLAVILFAIALNSYFEISNESSLLQTLLVKSKSNETSSDEEKIKNFLHWLRQNGAIISTHVTIASFPEFGGFGLQAVQNNSYENDNSNTLLQQGKSDNDDEDISNDEYAINYLEDMFTIPSSIIMTPMSIIHEYSTTEHKIPQFQKKLTQLVTKYIPSVSMVQQDVVIALYLMTQCTLGEDSKFKPYLDLLPSYIVPRLDTFNDEELDMLQDDDLAALAKESYGQLQSIWESHDLQSLLSSMIDSTHKKQGRHDVLDNDRKKQCISFHSFHKFVSIVSSRAMVIQGIKHLTPLAEFANYQARQDQRMALKGRMNQSFLLYHERNDETGSITVRADRNVRHGQQIFEDYGDIDNSLYLEAHGFVPDHNPFHCAVIPSKYIPSPQDLPTGLRDALVKLDILPDRGDNRMYPPPNICILEDGSLSDNRAEAYLNVAALTLMENKNNYLMTQCVDASQSSDQELIQLQCLNYIGHEEMLRKVIQKFASDTICDSKSRLSEDLIMLDTLRSEGDMGNTMKKVLALKFRIADKRILANVAGVNGDKCSNKQMNILKDIDIEKCPFSVMTEVKPLERNRSTQLENFNNFLDNLELPVRKIKAAFVGEGMRLGVVATENIGLGEVYLSIKKSSVINKDTICADKNVTKFCDFLSKYRSKSVDDGFQHLLLFLMYESFGPEKSLWQPYIDILPTVGEMKQYSPLFIDDKLYNYAAGSDLRIALIRNKKKAEDLLATMLLNKNIMRFLGDDAMNRDKFLWAYSIIDSRSIWFNGRRNLVPLLDLVNCMEVFDDETGSVNAIHKTYLDDSNNAVTKATSTYKAGDQIFENYGQPNHIYFSYHGFSLGDKNSHDCALWSGLGITSEDEGAKDMTSTRAELAKYGFTSTNPSFCIRDLTSLEDVARFLKIKHGLLDKSDNEPFSSEVIILLKRHLNDRISRFKAIKRSRLCTEESLPPPIHEMMSIVEREQKYFETALQEISSL